MGQMSSFSALYLSFLSCGGLKLNMAAFGCEETFHLSEWHIVTDNQLTFIYFGEFRLSNIYLCMILDSGRKPEYLEKT